jgi:hypothetical protein
MDSEFAPLTCCGRSANPCATSEGFVDKAAGHAQDTGDLAHRATFGPQEDLKSQRISSADLYRVNSEGDEDSESHE